MPTNKARNAQFKMVQAIKIPNNQLTNNESTMSGAVWQQQKSKTKHTPPSTPTTHRHSIEEK